MVISLEEPETINSNNSIHFKTNGKTPGMPTRRNRIHVPRRGNGAWNLGAIAATTYPEIGRISEPADQWSIGRGWTRFGPSRCSQRNYP